ncbi:hypothetical protein GCM10023340_23160 [Nocardioides marinquilinus]|uniref:Secreted protein n=1 Tax=Nocardioides marinquilinus TaxID=1210400 RepID=A0ABP9PMA8_9ACTN
MTTTRLPRLPRVRRSAGVLLAALLLGSGLTACGGDPGDTTCGEYLDKSDDERADLLEDAVDQDGDDEAKEAFDNASDDEKKVISDLIASTCEGEDADTKLDDVDDFS